MTAISKAFVVIADAAVDPDSPLDTTLLTGLRDDVVHLREWLGASFYAGAVQNHSHDGVDSFLIRIGPNFVRNGSFEDGSGGWTITTYTGGSQLISQVTRHHGQQSISFTSTVLANGGGDALSNEYVACGGAIADLLFEVWRSANVANVSSKAEVIWYDAAQAQISSSTIFIDTSTPLQASLAQTKLTPPALARFWRVRLTGPVPATGTATGTVFFDGVNVIGYSAQPFGKPMTVLKFGALDVTQAATRFMMAGGIAANATRVNGRWYMMENAKISQLRLFQDAVPPAGQNFVVTVEYTPPGGVVADTTVTATLGNASQFASDLTHSFEVEPGGYIDVKIVASATTGSTIDITATLVMESLNTGVGPAMMWASNVGQGAVAAAEFFGECGSTQSTVQADWEWLPGDSYYAGAAGSSTANFLPPNKNGTAVTMTRWDSITVTGMHPQPSNESPFASPRFNGSQRFVQSDNNDGSGTHDTSLCNVFRSINPAYRPAAPHLFSAKGQLQGTVVFCGGYGIAGRAVESEAQWWMPQCTVRNLRSCASAAPPAAQTRTATVRKNGADSALSATITNGGGRTATDLADSVSFNGTSDLMSISSTSSATAGTLSYHDNVEVWQ